ncbi:hypothetical protein [Agrococcus sp. DT81.2]|uniref:hypothetical protein n=1 Tax=Agrococcus sp. DT81.2 TaxID=3393414 RepID=UPI003CE4D997
MAKSTVPSGLGEAGARLWSQTVESYTLRADELEVLRAACAEADLIVRLEDALAGEPLTTSGSMGQIVAHPLISELRQHRSTLASLVRGLKLPDESGGEANQQREAAQTRWAAAYGK